MILAATVLLVSIAFAVAISGAIWLAVWVGERVIDWFDQL